MAMVNVADAGGVMLQMPMAQVAQGMMNQGSRGYPMGRYKPLDPKNEGKDLVLGEEVPIDNLKVGKVYDVVPATDLSTQHKEIYQKYTGTVKSVDFTDDGRVSAVIALSPAYITRIPGVYDITFRKNQALFFKKPGTNYGGRRTKKQKRRGKKRGTRRR